LIGEYTSNGEAIREYGWNPGGLWGTDTVWQKDANGTFLAHNDHLYTTDVLTKATDGSTAWRAVREAFGKTAVQPGALTTYLMRFSGQWEDGVGGFGQNWYREFHDRAGRYFSVDVLSPEKTPLRFAYSANNPLSNVDPFGLCDTTGRWVKMPEVAIHGLSDISFHLADKVSWSWWGYLKLLKACTNGRGGITAEVECTKIYGCDQITRNLKVSKPFNVRKCAGFGPNLYATGLGLASGSFFLGLSANILLGGASAAFGGAEIIQEIRNYNQPIVDELIKNGPKALCL